ncbi:MAG TPA: RDD family protein [Pyrinomonadaceae bacterium]|nr:RDD family protein [Pyrinomonadaceae bacterium]
MSLRLEQDRPVAPPRDARARAYVGRDDAGVAPAGAPFTLRCGALLIDYIFLAGVLAFATMLARTFGDTGRGSSVVLTGGIVAVGIVAVLNFVIVAGLTGRTFGKWLTGLRVERNSDGTPVSFARALVRHTVGYALTAATLGLGFLLAAFNSRGRALHDLVAGTVVVRSRGARSPLR